MHGAAAHVDGFAYGALTPLAGYAMACLGGALGLRCTVRALSLERSRRSVWLALGALAFGSGIWTMHFIAMMGFTISEVNISYNVPLTVLSLLVAVVVVGMGVFAVGWFGRTAGALLGGGLAMGLGIAAMHYMGMAAMRMNGDLEYSVSLVAASIGIAVVAATAALWAAVSITGLAAALGASLIMGVAVSGMHYTGMAALSVHLGHASQNAGGSSPASFLVAILLGPMVCLLVASLAVAVDPLSSGGAKRSGEVKKRGQEAGRTGDDESSTLRDSVFDSANPPRPVDRWQRTGR